jgi:hypothetical protein
MLFRFLNEFVVVCGSQIFFVVFTEVHNWGGAMCKGAFTIKVVNHPRSLQSSESLSLALCPHLLAKKKNGCFCSLLIIFYSVRHVRKRLSMKTRNPMTWNVHLKTKTSCFFFKKPYLVFNPELFMFSAISLLTTVKLDNGVNTGYVVVWPWKEVCYVVRLTLKGGLLRSTFDLERRSAAAYVWPWKEACYVVRLTLKGLLRLTFDLERSSV